MAGWLNIWLTPLWIFGVGVVLGFAILLVAWGVLFLVSRDAGKAIPRIIAEGPLLPVTWIAFAFAAFGIVGGFAIRDSVSILSSLARLKETGTQTLTVTLPAAAPDQQPESVKAPFLFRGEEFRRLAVDTSEDVTISTPPHDTGTVDLLWSVDAGEDFSWSKRSNSVSALNGKVVDGLYATNNGDDDARVTLSLTTAPLHPQAQAIPITAVSVVGAYLLFLITRWICPKIAAIAHATSISEMAQPLFLVLAVLGFCTLAVFVVIPYHTFGEDIKVLKDSGLTLIMVFCIFHAVWAASNSVSEEIDGKTALTVLSKPVSRRQFILGKFTGIAWTEFALFVILGAWFLVLVAYKPIYDGRETGKFDPTWQISFLEVSRTIPGLVLAFLETLVFVAISVAISTRLPMLANVSVCFAIYALGHLTPLIVQSNLNSFEPVSFVGRLIATVLPVLDHFNIQAAIAAGVAVPLTYLATAAFYCGVYCTIALLVALVLFEDRDLA